MTVSKSKDRSKGLLELVKQRSFWVKWAPLIIVVTYITGLFVYGWFFDSSHPRGGSGWADQSLYRAVTERFINGDLPKPGQLHYAVGYSLIGVIGSLLVPSYPFLAVSYALLMGSAVLCYLAAKKLIGVRWSLIFIFLLFFFYSGASSIQHAPELFFVPWNNQVLFFAFAFYFWILSTRAQENFHLGWKLPVIASGVAGITISTREESLFFIIPLLLTYLFLSKQRLKIWLICLCVLSLLFLPQAITKHAVLGSVLKTGGTRTYSQTKGEYLRPDLLIRNTKETIVDSKNNGGRPALLQAAPWLIISPIGMGILLLGKKWPLGVKVFTVVSVGLLMFYLSGANMSAHKLKFNCLRYIAPSFIILNFATVVVLREGWQRISSSKALGRNG